MNEMTKVKEAASAAVRPVARWVSEAAPGTRRGVRMRMIWDLIPEAEDVPLDALPRQTRR